MSNIPEGYNDNGRPKSEQVRFASKYSRQKSIHFFDELRKEQMVDHEYKMMFNLKTRYNDR